MFEFITATAFSLFAANPADLCILEVGIGGRLDATNVVQAPKACAITSISLDHCEVLGETVEAIALEKVGILKPGATCILGAQEAIVEETIISRASRLGLPVLKRNRDWTIERVPGGLRYRDDGATLKLPPTSLQGEYQLDNAGIAIAALRAINPGLDESSVAYGIGHAEWPARMQRLRGRLASILPPDSELFLDGGHNRGASAALAEHLRTWRDRPIHLIVGMKQAKDCSQFWAPLIPLASTLWAVSEPGQFMSLSVQEVGAASGGRARPGPGVKDALHKIAQDCRSGRVLVCGSLYLAGEVLKMDLGSVDFDE